MQQREKSFLNCDEKQHHILKQIELRYKNGNTLFISHLSNGNAMHVLYSKSAPSSKCHKTKRKNDQRFDYIVT